MRSRTATTSHDTLILDCIITYFMEKEELRKKIKQLKYKIEKEEVLNQELIIKTNHLKELQLQGTNLSIQS